MTIETRSVSAHQVLAETAADVHYVTLRAIVPNVVDDYGSLWNPHAFDRSLAVRLPTLLWGHNWQEPIGRAVSYAASNDGPLIKFRFDDFTKVPRAAQAYAQCMPHGGQPATIDDCSVGFRHAKRRQPTPSEYKQFPGVDHVIDEADLDEVSLVVVGAVPGAKVDSVRSGRPLGGFARDLEHRAMVREVTAWAERAVGHVTSTPFDLHAEMVRHHHERARRLGVASPARRSIRSRSTADERAALAEADEALAALMDRGR